MALPNPVKALAFFEDMRYKVGWTETMYIMNQNTLRDALVEWERLLAKRVLLLGAGIRNVYNSVSQDNPELLGDVEATGGLPMVEGKLGAPDYYNPAYATKDTDFAWTAVLCRASALSQYHRPLWLSGAPDDIQLDAEGRIIDKNWLTLFLDWASVLCGVGANNPKNYGIKAWSKDIGVSPIVHIIRVDSGANIGWTFTCKENHAMNVGDQFFVHGVVGDPKALKPHGVYQISNLVGLNGMITTEDSNAAFKYRKAGYLRKRIVGVFPIDQVIQQRIRKKSRGRPFFLLRGRAKAP